MKSNEELFALAEEMSAIFKYDKKKDELHNVGEAFDWLASKFTNPTEGQAAIVYVLAIRDAMTRDDFGKKYRNS